MSAPEPNPGTRARLRVWIKLLTVNRIMQAELREKMRLEFGSTLPRFDVMAALDREPQGMRMSALSSALMVSNGNITGIVDRLVSDGVVERLAVPGDRRAFIVRLTEAGQHEFAARAAIHAGWIDELLQGLSEEDADTITAILRKVVGKQREQQ
ncbi:MAG: MarR family transcriptional regulator [Paracoccaceae bacterium]